MPYSSMVMSVGAVCFGLTVGFFTYRTLIRSKKTSVSDLTAVIGAIGGAAVTGLFNPNHGDLFGWYSIGLAVGVALYFVGFRVLNGAEETATVMEGRTLTPSDLGATDDPEVRPRG
jgi:hypothetical protein